MATTLIRRSFRYGPPSQCHPAAVPAPAVPR